MDITLLYVVINNFYRYVHTKYIPGHMCSYARAHKLLGCMTLQFISFTIILPAPTLTSFPPNRLSPFFGSQQLRRSLISASPQNPFTSRSVFLRTTYSCGSSCKRVVSSLWSYLLGLKELE